MPHNIFLVRRREGGGWSELDADGLCRLGNELPPSEPRDAVERWGRGASHGEAVTVGPYEVVALRVNDHGQIGIGDRRRPEFSSHQIRPPESVWEIHDRAAREILDSARPDQLAGIAVTGSTWEGGYEAIAALARAARLLRGWRTLLLQPGAANAALALSHYASVGGTRADASEYVPRLPFDPRDDFVVTYIGRNRTEPLARAAGDSHFQLVVFEDAHALSMRAISRAAALFRGARLHVFWEPGKRLAGLFPRGTLPRDVETRWRGHEELRFLPLEGYPALTEAFIPHKG